MKMLVTGGAGFIGSNFIRYMLGRHKDLEIVNFDVLTYAGNLESLKDVEGDSRYSFIKGDITDPLAVLAAMTGVDTVVHFAAESHVDRSILEPAGFVKTNVVGTQVLLDAACLCLHLLARSPDPDQIYRPFAYCTRCGLRFHGLPGSFFLPDRPPGQNAAAERCLAGGCLAGAPSH